MRISTVMPSDHGGAHRWVVFGVIATVYFLVYFHRVSISVIAQELLETFAASATSLGLMSSMYFYLYAVEQPLVGYLADSLGPRRVIGLWSLLAAAGCFIFAVAPSIVWASVGRALIGLGVGGVYVPAMKAFSQWFRKQEFSFITGLLMAIGNLGAVVATTPLAWLSGALGWRLSFAAIGTVTLLLVAATLTLIRDAPTIRETGARPLPQTGGRPRGPTRRILSSVHFWVFSATFFGIYGTFLTFQGLWATPYLMVSLGIDTLEASRITMLIPIGFIVGAPFFGWLADRVFTQRILIFNGLLALETLVWIGLTFGTAALGQTGLMVLMVMMGGGIGGFIAVLWSLMREVTPPAVFGYASGLLNPAPFLGVAVFQVWTGAILDRFDRVGAAYPPEAYREAFLVCLLATAVCLLLSIALRKRIFPA